MASCLFHVHSCDNILVIGKKSGKGNDNDVSLS